ncbi:MAG: enoyl-CoA hydratase/isomerase family protein [Nitriliruptoraceae bacterium]
MNLERHDDGVAVLTLDDPDRRNAMTAAMGDELARRCDELTADDGLRVVVLTGTPPAFSAGGDLDMLEDLARRAREEHFDAGPVMRAFYTRFLRVGELPVPVIAAVNGHAVGAGLCVALAADLRIVSTSAKLGLNFARLGLHPGMGGSWFLPRLLGPERAAAWLYTGALYDGATATAQGLALEAVESDAALPRALELAAEIAASSPVVVRQLKRTLTATPQLDLATALAGEAAAQAVSYASADLAEGLAAARAKRPARFPGH